MPTLDAEVAAGMIRALTSTLVSEGLAMTKEERRDHHEAIIRHQLTMAIAFGRARGAIAAAEAHKVCRRDKRASAAAARAAGEGKRLAG